MAQKKEKTAVVVPKEEQPYEVPENWLWVRLGSVYKINPKNTADDEVDVAFIPMEKISAGMFSKFEYDIQTWGKAKKGHTQFANGDVAFAKISPCFENRKSMIVENLPNGLGAGTTELIILRQPQINQKFTFWLINTDDFIQKGKRTYSGTVGQQRINMDFVKNYPIPLPPLPEQQRIVNIIESLFKNLDEAKERLLEVKKGFGERKAALLHKAFTGELTAKWRERNGVGLESWEEIKLGSICKEISYGYTAKSIINNNFPKMLRITDIQDNYVNWSNVPNCDIDGQNLSKYKLFDGDIVFARTGATTGKSYLIESPPCAVYASYLIRIKLADEVDTKYIYDFLQSPSYWEQISDMSAGIAQPGVNAQKLKNLGLSLPTLPEQKEIVRILDAVLSAEKDAEQKVDSVIEGIDLLKKSILARAFRGELGTNNPAEEKAIKL